DYMSKKLITFTSDQTIEEVITALIKHRISGGPVVNEKYELICMISEGDCVKHISESRYYNSPMQHMRVKDCMIDNVETIDGNMNICDAANKYLNSNRRRFPIVENGRLIRQISQMDILIATINLKYQTC